jgi:hypothetical protein
MAERRAERLEALAHRVLGPLVLGGRLRLVPPFGRRLALELGEGTRIADDELRGRIELGRLRVARLYAPIDTIDELDLPGWAMLACLNDLIQSTNHELSGPLSRGRHLRLIASVDATLDALAPPETVASLLARHATFARVLELARTDTSVRWWTGRQSFRGQPPDVRLLAWPGLRRVVVEPSRVSLPELCRGMSELPVERYHGALSRWLGLTPLTDLANAARLAPVFVWQPGALRCLAVRPARTLALRASVRGGAANLAALERATAWLGDSRAGVYARSFVAELREMFAREPAQPVSSASADAARASLTEV